MTTPISGRRTVLVIEDEAIIRMLITEGLEDAGIEVLQAGDGASGLRCLEDAARMDLLVTDIGLPGGMSGRDVARKARLLWPELRILFVTGYDDGAADDGLDGRSATITKPFGVRALVAKVTQMLDR